MPRIQKGQLMKEEMIRQYAAILRDYDLTSLEVNEKEDFVRMERVPAPVAIATPQPVPMAVQPTNPAAVPVAAMAEDTPAAPAGYHSVRSPMIGVFYAASAENADPFVVVGQQVKEGDTLCIIEAMKLMSEIPADCDGEIIEICVRNGQTVEVDTELFRIKRSP